MSPGSAIESHRFVLELPSVPAYVGTARLFAAAVARHFEIGEEEVEDLKLAVSEACTRSIRQPGDVEPVRVIATVEDRRLRVEIEGASGKRGSPVAEDTDEMVAGMGLAIIAGLFPDATATDRPDGGASITFSLPLDDVSRLA